MRSYLLCGVAILMGCGSMLQAAPQGRKTVRSVQLISMTVATLAPASAEAPDEGRGEETKPSVDIGAVLGEFRVHDLSRRWVEFQMADSFTPRTPSAAQAAVDDDDPFARVGVAQLGAAPVAGYTIPSVSSMPIPAWMRGGPVFAAAVNRYVPGCTAAGYRPSGFLTADTEYRRLRTPVIKGAIRRLRAPG